MITRLALWPRRLVSGARLYRRTPVALRRPEPLPPLYAHGYFAAATLGVIGLGFLVTRRYRVGLGLVAGMLAVGQLVTIAAVV